MKMRNAAIMGLACVGVYGGDCGLSAFNQNSFEPTQIILEDMSSPEFNDKTFWKEVADYEA